MVKEIEINGIKCRMKSSASIPRMYRMKFNRDIFVDMTKLRKQLDRNEKAWEKAKEEAKEKGIEIEDFESDMPINSLEMFENIAYLMHKHGDPKQPTDINEWLEQFETFDIYEVLPQILEMWNIENTQMSTAKKKRGK